MNPQRVGCIGLGAMGDPMARNLHRAGLLTGVWNRTDSKSRILADACSCKVFTSPETMAAECDGIVICVSADADVLDVIARLLPGLQAGTLIVDLSTVADTTAQQASAVVRAAGGRFLDAPVSGGVEGARQGRLSIMVGGEAADLEDARPLLEALGSRITHMGPVGAGQATKAVNQVMAAGINQAVSESLAFAQALGLPLDKVVEVTSAGAAGNWFLQHRGPTMSNGQVTPGFKLNLHHKDLNICKTMAARFDVALPLVEMTLIHYQRLLEAGYGEEDISALLREKQRVFQKHKPSS